MIQVELQRRGYRGEGRREKREEKENQTRGINSTPAACDLDDCYRQGVMVD